MCDPAHVALEVLIQAAAIAYAVFGLSTWIEGGGVLDKAGMESETTDFTGVGGFALHGINGQVVVEPRDGPSGPDVVAAAHLHEGARLLDGRRAVLPVPAQRPGVSGAQPRCRDRRGVSG